MRRGLKARICGAAGLGLVLAGAVTVTAAVASNGGASRTLGTSGVYANAISVEPGSIGGYNASPTAYDVTDGAVTLQYTFTVDRFQGDGAPPAWAPVTVPLVLQVEHITTLPGISDEGLATGDPGLTTGTNPPFSENWILNNQAGLLGDVVSTQDFVVMLPAERFDTAGARTSAQSVTETLNVTIPGAGYYLVRTGGDGTICNEPSPETRDSGAAACCPQPPLATVATGRDASGNDNGSGNCFTDNGGNSQHDTVASRAAASTGTFSVLTSSVVRAIVRPVTAPSPTPSATPTPTPTATPAATPAPSPTATPSGGVQATTTTPTPTPSPAGSVEAATISVPSTGAAGGNSANALLGAGIAMMGAGIALVSAARPLRRRRHDIFSEL